MRRLAGLVGVFLLGMSSSLSAACPGDCNGNGVVSIDELVTAVRIALGQAPLAGCPNADSSGEANVTVDDLVRAVNAALRGCPSTATPTRPATETETVRATATLTATIMPTPTVPAASPSATSGGTASPTMTGVATATPTPTETEIAPATVTAMETKAPTTTSTAPATEATASPTPSEDASPTFTPTTEATATETTMPSSTPTASATVTSPGVPGTPTGAPTATATPSPSRSSSPTATSSATQTPTATRTVSATSTPTGGPLGTRRFSLNPATSAFISVLSGNAQVSVSGFTGYLDLQAGIPDPQTGRTLINITGASPYLQLSSDQGLICIQPLVPVTAAGVIDCNGGTNLGTTVRQDHRLGTVGVGDFTAQSCANADGMVESDAFPHPTVCNGPLTVEPFAGGDSGPGAVAISPDPIFGTMGLPARLTFEAGPQCTGSGDALETILVLLSSDTQTEIEHVDNGPSTLVYANSGENFSCPTWTQENGPGHLILSFPTLHGTAIGTDLINVFVFDD